MQTTATNLFKIKKTKIEAPENNHYAEKIPVTQNYKNYKRHTYFKNCFQCYNTKIGNKHHFNVVWGKPLCPGKCFEEWHNYNQLEINICLVHLGYYYLFV